MINWFPSPRIAVAMGSFIVYWYGVLYVLAFALAYFLVARLQRYRGLSLSPGQLLELLTWGAIGVVVGGRLGYVALYEPGYYAAHPWEIVQLSQGGMSSHGGFVGVAVAVWWWNTSSPDKGRKGGVFAASQTPSRSPLSGGNAFLRLLDIITVPAALGLALGRLGNVINHELYVTPAAQLVAVASPLIIVGMCYWHLRRTQKPGTTLGLFLVLYSLFRWGEEYLRAPQWPLVLGWITRGQLYTVPLLVIGIWLLRAGWFAVWSKDGAGD